MSEKLGDEFIAWASSYLHDKWEECGLPAGVYQEFMWFAQQAESPIERKMLAGLLFCDFGFLDHPACLCRPDELSVDVVAKSRSAIICPQAQIQKLKWRVDFFIVLPTFGRGLPPKLVIECDGHDFHERTKDQAARDRKRDRDLQALSIPILRFTGSEIYRDLDHCIEQISTFGSNLIEAAWRADDAERGLSS